MKSSIIQKFINVHYVRLKSNVHTSVSKKNPRAGTVVDILCLVAFTTISDSKLWKTVVNLVYPTALGFLLVTQVLFYTCKYNNLGNY